MQAFRLIAPHRAELTDVPKPTPAPGEVVVQVASAGVCHSDLHLMEWNGAELAELGLRLPFTLGHECAGFVAELGAGVRGFAPGDPVAVYGAWGCGHCRTCRTSAETHCERASELGYMGAGLGRDGAEAEYLLVPSSRLLLPLGKLDPSTAAPLTDAALTPYHAMKGALPSLVGGTTAVVLGVGGLGHMAVQLLKALCPARVVACDVSTDKLALAKSVGADVQLRSEPGAADAVRELTRGLGAELVLDFVGTSATMALAAKMVRQRGEISVVGLAGGKLEVSFGALPFDAAIRIPYWGSAVELMDVLALAEQGKIRVDVERFPLSKAMGVYKRLRDGAITGRAVLDPRV
ncbi:MAG TPA: NAD(P)-dependent alcohol dehydrogenase [Minicystis sp.]|nr:NAD(P)-dependent alcohol dehydrogenase [Minicystis sp.]